MSDDDGDNDVYNPGTQVRLESYSPFLFSVFDVCLWPVFAIGMIYFIFGIPLMFCRVDDPKFTCEGVQGLQNVLVGSVLFNLTLVLLWRFRKERTRRMGAHIVYQPQ